MLGSNLDREFFGGLSLRDIRQLIVEQNALAGRHAPGSDERQVFIDTAAVLEDFVSYVKEVSKALTRG